MKNHTYIVLLILLAAVPTSCKDWLEATSSTQIQASKLFDSRSGFYDAISGVYIGMGNNGYCYGGDYTWDFNDRAAFPFQYTTTDPGYYIQIHNYTRSDVRTQVDRMWSQGYNVIANINLLLRELENNREVITTEEEYNLMRGELLGLRAYLHFDLMRMFGVNSWSGENATKRAVPYVTVYNREPTNQLSYSETAGLLLQDVNEALELLYNDPITGRESEEFNSSCNQEGFWNTRTKHLNFYALEGLAARIYQWMGDTATAAAYASDVIDGALTNGAVSWVDIQNLLTTADFDARDWTFSTEHLFSLEVTGLSDLVEYDYFYSIDSRFTYSSSFISNVLFSDPIAGLEDIRGTALLVRFGMTGYRNYKLYTSDTYYTAYRNRIPMVKIPEMYYIVAEDCIARGDNDGALDALNVVRSHRGITDNLDAATDADEELMLEYYREFVCEGQLFYWLKYKNVQSSINSEFNLSASDLIYPYPDDEIDYGRVQDY